MFVLRESGDPLAPIYYLSHLELARVLAKKDQAAAARAEYRAFLDTWKNADPGLPALLLARREIAALR